MNNALVFPMTSVYQNDIDLNPHLMRVFDEFFIPLIIIDADTRLVWSNSIVQTLLKGKHPHKLQDLIYYGLFEKNSYPQIEKFIGNDTHASFPSKINTDLLLLPLKETSKRDKKIYLLFLPHLNSDKKENNSLYQAHQYLNLLLPSQLPELKGFHISHFYQPNSKLGGDLYNVIKVSENKIAFFIADVSGFGLSASLQAMIIKKLLEVYLATSETPSVIMEKLNNIKWYY